MREQALKKKDLEFQDHLCRFIRFLQVHNGFMPFIYMSAAISGARSWPPHCLFEGAG